MHDATTGTGDGGDVLLEGHQCRNEIASFFYNFMSYLVMPILDCLDLVSMQLALMLRL